MTMPSGNMPKPRKSSKVDSHSNFSATRSEHYHTKVIGASPKGIKRLNPTKVLPEGRSFPSIPN
jgi:hypothetical protein